MEQLHHREMDKLATDADHLSRLLETDDLSDDALSLALATAKRVRRTSTLLIRLLAELRDNQR